MSKFNTDPNPAVLTSITISKEIKQHKGTSKYGDSWNGSVGGLVSVTVTEASPGKLSHEQLYAEADSLLSAAVEQQLEENTYILRNMRNVE